MLSEQEKKEILEDSVSLERKKSFEIADEKASVFFQKYLASLTVDKVIKFLMDTQDVTGPFPISKTIPSAPFDFRL